VAAAGTDVDLRAAVERRAAQPGGWCSEGHLAEQPASPSRDAWPRAEISEDRLTGFHRLATLDA
jgi:hypothetical protein